MLTRRVAIVGAIAGLFVAACGSSSDEAKPAATEAAATTQAAAATTAASGGGAATGDPIIIGAAVDLTSNMAPVDGPPLDAAMKAVEDINAKGGVLGRPLEIKVIDTKLDEAQTKAAALEHITKNKADILYVTCDVDFSTPAIQEGINAGKLTVAPCIGTDQMGPKRFGDKGKLAFTFGNVAQDEGAAMAEWAVSKGYKTAITITDNLLVYFQNTCDSFAKRFEEKGGKIVSKEAYTSFDGSSANIPTALTSAGATDLLALCAFDPEITTVVKGVRDAGMKTPFISPWSGDGTYWVPEGLSDFNAVTYASIFGDDPNPAVQDLITKIGKPQGKGGFVAGYAMIEALAKAIEQTGSTDGAALAATLEGFKGVDTISGKVSFSPELHSVYGREYRVITITGGKGAYTGAVTASSPVDLG